MFGYAKVTRLLIVVVAALTGLPGPLRAGHWYLVEVNKGGEGNGHYGEPEGTQGVRYDYLTANHFEFVEQNQYTQQWAAGCRFCSSVSWGRNPESPPGEPGWCGLTELEPEVYEGAWSAVEFNTAWEGSPIEVPPAWIRADLEWRFLAHAELPGSWAGGIGWLDAEASNLPPSEENPIEEYPEVLADVYPEDEPPEDDSDDQGERGTEWGADDGDRFLGRAFQTYEEAQSSETTDSFARSFVDYCEVNFLLIVGDPGQ